jgi:hypothetical protein
VTNQECEREMARINENVYDLTPNGPGDLLVELRRTVEDGATVLVFSDGIAQPDAEWQLAEDRLSLRILDPHQALEADSDLKVVVL